MNILICSPMQNEISFLHGRLEKFFVNHGTESVILSFPDVTFIMKGMSIQPEERYSDMEQLDLAICNAVGEEKTKNENQNSRNMGNSFVGVNDEGKNGDLRINDKQFMPQILCAAAGVLFLILLIILILIL